MGLKAVCDRCGYTASFNSEDVENAELTPVGWTVILLTGPRPAPVEDDDGHRVRRVRMGPRVELLFCPGCAEGLNRRLSLELYRLDDQSAGEAADPEPDAGDAAEVGS